MSQLNPDGPSEALLSRIEDAGINASAPPQQRWLDGWLLRFGRGKARRARCVQAVADGRLPLDQRLALCADVFRQASLPMMVRITPFSRPLGLDYDLATRGFHAIDNSRVMVASQCPASTEPLPADLQLERLAAVDFAQAVGELRGSSADETAGLAERLLHSPVPYQAWVLRRHADGAVLACCQVATEGELVGLYDVFTHPDARGQGLARRLCAGLLAQSRAAGARVAYLQVLATNAPARAVYRRLGFADAYDYHYRTPEAESH